MATRRGAAAFLVAATVLASAVAASDAQPALAAIPPPACTTPLAQGHDVQFTVAVLAADGSVMSWGLNSGGELGQGTVATVAPFFTLSPAHVVDVTGQGSLTGVVSVVSGTAHTLALKSTGELFAWGDDFFGQLGNGRQGSDPTGHNVLSATPVQVLGPAGQGFLTGVTSIAAGLNNSMALKSDGSVWVWGFPYGSTPFQITGFNHPVVRISAGAAHYVALLSDGTVWTWGSNSNGQLGNGTTVSSSVPVQVLQPIGGLPLTGVAQVAASQYDSYALDTAGGVWAWGSNVLGQLGDSSTIDSSLPVEVNLPVAAFPVLGIRGGILTAFAWGATAAYGWGQDNADQLGNGTDSSHGGPEFFSTPVQVLSPPVADIAPGDTAVSALYPDGTLRGWATVNIGDSSPIINSSPPVVLALSGVAQPQSCQVNAALPLTVSVTGPSSLAVVPTVAFPNDYFPNPFTVSATTQNLGTGTTQALTLSLSLQAGLSLAPGQTADHRVPDIGPSGTATTSWQVLASRQVNDTTLNYSATAFAANAPAVTATRSIFVPAAGFYPSRNGYFFVNDTPSFADPRVPSYEAMAGYYPDSRGEMYYFGSPIRTIQGRYFYDHWFATAFNSGYCYGMAASSTFMYNSASPTRQPIYNLQSAQAASPVPPDATLQALIERFHARQYGLGGATASTKSWAASAAFGNLSAFDQIAAQVRIRPQLVAIGPAPTRDTPKFWRQFDHSHAVVAYATLFRGNTRMIKVYDPNAPGDDGARIEVDPSGSMTLVHDTPSEITYGNGQPDNAPTDWILMPLDDAAFGSAGNTKWMVDALNTLAKAFLIGSIPGALVGIPFFSIGANPANPGYAEQLPAGTGYATTITAAVTNSQVAEMSGSRLVVSTQTDSNAAGSTHDVAISADGTQLHLGAASTTEHFTVQLGADYLPNYGRQVTLTGLTLVPNATVDLKADATTNSLVLSSTGASQTVPATIDQTGQNAGSATVQLSIPGAGSQASITVFDWNDLAHSLIYETTTVNGMQVVTILKDNPAQRSVAIDALFSQLNTSISTITDPDVRKALTFGVQVAQTFFHKGNHKPAANILIGVEFVAKALSGTKIPASTAASIVSLSQQIRGLL